VREGFLYDYATDDRVVYRINRILRAIGAPTLPDSLVEFVAEARPLVRQSMRDLLQSPPTQPPFPFHDDPSLSSNAVGIELP
jgi:hypothetical protein